jgi:hypothetical protein
MNVRQAALAGLLILVLSLVCGCDFGRMYDQDVIKTYGQKMPEMDKRTAPVQDGFQELVNTDPRSLKNPLPYSKTSLERGYRVYGYYCVQCHGVNSDGSGTVGQSFAPLPANLTSPEILSQKDGQLYAKIRLGFKRHPVLFSTVAAEDTWAVIVHMRSGGR